MTSSSDPALNRALTGDPAPTRDQAPADGTVELLPSLPSMGTLFAKALVPSLDRGEARLPTRTAMVTGFGQDLARLADYDRVCGFTLRDRVPPTWLHVLTFPLQVHLLSGPESTIRLAGIVHVSNRMTLHRPVLATDELALSVRATNLRPHKRGALLDLVGRVQVADEVAWEGVSTYLAAGVRVPGDLTPTGTPHDAEVPIAGSAVWRLPRDLGVDYRRVSEDPNPIHTNVLAARAFGFTRPIIHGMWTHARALAALEPRLPEAYSVEVRFTRPIMLPATVSYGAIRTATGWRQAVLTRDGTKTHMTAMIDTTATHDR